MKQVTLEQLLMIPKSEFKGKIICFPTDTVYGIGGCIDDETALLKIFAMKNRPTDKPLAILCSSVEQITKYVSVVPEEVKMLIDKHWPGALTIIFEKSKALNPLISKVDTVAFRMPDSTVALTILDYLGLMATTSVNESGKKEINTLEEIAREFGDYIDYLVIDDQIMEKLPSTVVDAKTMKVLREGSIKLG